MRHSSDWAKNTELSGDITQEEFEELATLQQRLEAGVSLVGQPGNLPRLSPGGVAWYRVTRYCAKRQTFRGRGGEGICRDTLPPCGLKTTRLSPV